MSEEHIDILDLLQLLENHRVEAIASIVRLAIREIKRLRAKIQVLCQEIEELEGENGQPA